jgi:ATP-binding cassette, subfamily C, bacterial
MSWKKRLKEIPKFYQRERTPTLLQMDNAECGAVVLAIILGYFGRFVPLAEVRDACDVTRDGSKAINIVKAARRYGLDAHGMQLTMDNIKLLPPPFIIYWQFNHFLIVEGFTEDKVYLNDPATGPRQETLEEFSRSFTGVALFMTPSEDFHPGGKPEPGIVKLLWQYLAGSRGSFFYIIFVALTLAIPAAGLAILAKVFLDNILLNGQHDWLPQLLLAMLIGAFMMAGLTWLKNYYLARLYMKLKLSGSLRFFWRLLHLPFNFFQQRAVGDIAERVEAHSYLADTLAGKITGNIAGLLGMILLAMVMFLISWPLAIINLAVALLNFLLLWFISRFNADLGRRFAQTAGKLSGIEMNGLQIIETLKANAVENQFFNYWASVYAQKITCQQRMEKNESLLKILPVLSQGLNIVALLAFGSWFILHGELSPGGLIATLILMFSLNQPLMKLLQAGEQLYKLKGHIARMMDIQQHPVDNILSSAETGIPLVAVAGQPILTMRDVEFGYSKLEPPILAGISLQIKPGERVAVVGPTGGGKSSIAKLICGLFVPWSGEILVHGQPLSKISRHELAGVVGLVDQQIFLFSATVRENLTLWNPHVSDAQIYQALEVAEIADIIRQRGGMECWIDERGKNFSGGQVQRLEIARALIGQPELLILDEATAGLDPLIEQQIYSNLQQQGCALLIIAHRLSAIRDCDQILVINDGKIVQHGHHDSLIMESGLYKELVSLEIQ